MFFRFFTLLLGKHFLLCSLLIFEPYAQKIICNTQKLELLRIMMRDKKKNKAYSFMEMAAFVGKVKDIGTSIISPGAYNWGL